MDNAATIKRLIEAPHGRSGPMRVLGVCAPAASSERSATASLLEMALAHARAEGADVRSFNLAHLRYRSCPAPDAGCGWPCFLSLLDAGDQLAPVYDAMVNWADVLLVAVAATGTRTAPAFHSFIERLRCIRHELDTNQRLLVRSQVAAFLVLGCEPAGGCTGFPTSSLSDLGYVLPAFPIVRPRLACMPGDFDEQPDIVERIPGFPQAVHALVNRSLELGARISRPGAQVQRAS